LDLLFGRWRSQVLHAGVALGIFESVGDSPRLSPDIAQDLNLDPNLAYRLLRALGAIDLLVESADGHFSITESGRYLAKDHPESLRAMTLLAEAEVWQEPLPGHLVPNP